MEESCEGSFLKLVEVQQCTAKDLYTGLIKILFEEIGVPKRNLFGFASDNASVMMGGGTREYSSKAFARFTKPICS
jgi:hypothetical protein